MREVDRIIVGAGIGGLTLALSMHDAGQSCVVLERSEKVGGFIQSLHLQGYLLECGPNTIVLRKDLKRLIERVGLSDELQFAAERGRSKYLWNDRLERLVPVPHGLKEALVSPFLSPLGKLRLMLEPFVQRTSQVDQSVGDFFARRLGAEFTNAIVAPVLGGIWAADISQLSMRSALAKIWELEQESGSLVLGGLSRLRSRSRVERDERKIVGLFPGLEALPEGICRALPADSVIRGSSVIDLSRVGGRIVLRTERESFRANQAVLAISPKHTAQLIRKFDLELASRLEDLPCASVGVMHLGVKLSNFKSEPNGFGCLIPPRPGRALLGVIFASSMYPSRAPEGRALLTCFCGGAHNPELSRVSMPTVQQQVVSELSRYLGMTGEPTLLHVNEYHQCLPNYPVGHFKTLQAAAEFELRYPEIKFLSGWQFGPGIPDRVSAAMELANILISKSRENLSEQSASIRRAMS